MAMTEPNAYSLVVKVARTFPRKKNPNGGMYEEYTSYLRMDIGTIHRTLNAIPGGRAVNNLPNPGKDVEKILGKQPRTETLVVYYVLRRKSYDRRPSIVATRIAWSEGVLLVCVLASRSLPNSADGICTQVGRIR